MNTNISDTTNISNNTNTNNDEGHNNPEDTANTSSSNRVNPIKNNNTQHEIKVLFGNAQSLKPKLDTIIATTKSINYDILAFNETWFDMKDKHLDAEISIQGYRHFFVDKPTPTKKGGGSILYVKEKLLPVCKKTVATTKYEILQVNIKPAPNVIIKIVLIYRNTIINANEDTEFYAELENITNTSNECVIMGDFNLPGINWQTVTALAPGSRLTQFIHDNSLKQHVSQPTRQLNILDLVITTEDDLVGDLEVLDKLSDHNAIIFNIKAEAPGRQSSRYSYNFRRANFQALINEIDNIGFEELFNGKNAEECFSILKRKILESSTRNIPQKKSKLTLRHGYLPKSNKQ